MFLFSSLIYTMVTMLRLLHRILAVIGNEGETIATNEEYTEDAEMLKVESAPIEVMLKKLLWKEERSDELQAIPVDFYARLSNKIRLMRKSEDEKVATHLECLSIDLLRRRIQKIMEIVSMNPRVSKEVISRMSFEERVLYNALCRTVATWENYMSRYVGGGD